MGGQWVTEAELAEYDDASARTFGRACGGAVAAEESSPLLWRSGPPGEMTLEEYDRDSALSFAQMNGATADAAAHRQVAETARQIAVEQQLLREASAKGWDALRAGYSGRDAEIVESIRARLGGGSSARLRESAGAALLAAGVRVPVREATAGAPTQLGGRRIRVTLLTPGQGSSGFYPPETLEAAARDKTFPKGTHMMIDHPTQTEQYDRPERSVRDLAAVLTTDATWNGSALTAEAQVFPQFADLITALEGVIGVSIRAQGEIEPSTVNGQPVRRITRLTNAESVDFVTKAGRGGTYEVLESWRARWAS